MSTAANRRLSFGGMGGYKRDAENEELSDLLGYNLSDGLAKSILDRRV